VPTGVVAAVGIVIGATAVASASEPSLPAQSVAQLLVDVQQGTSKPLGPLTATVQETANLGLPALPQIGAMTGQGGDLGALSPLAGTTSVTIWYLDQQHIRIAKPVQMGESDLRLDGRQLWLWNSKTQTATHVVLPALAPRSQTGPSTYRASVNSMSPMAAVSKALAAVGPTTTVKLGPNVTVAGRPAYQISIAPKGSGSLISQILIAIDASRHIPLQVQVFARGSSSPAFQLGYTALTFGPPAMSNFTFTPPAGAKVKTETVPNSLPGGLAKGGLPGLDLPGLGLSGLGPLGVFGGPGISIHSSCSPAAGQVACAPRMIPAARAKAMMRLRAELRKKLTPAQRAAALKAFQKEFAATVPLIPSGPRQPQVLPKAVLQQMRKQFIANLPKNLTPAQRAAAIAAFDKKFNAAVRGGFANNGGGFFNLKAPSVAPSGAPKTVGTGWTSVLVTPANPGVAAAVNQLLSGKAATSSGWTGFSPLGGSSSSSASSASSSQMVYSSTPGQTPPVPIGPDLMVLRALLRATTAVHGSWGSGRLLQTTLLTVLITSKGQILAGAVTPSVLYTDAASLSK
jgi:hypothetical protein